MVMRCDRQKTASVSLPQARSLRPNFAIRATYFGFSSVFATGNNQHLRKLKTLHTSQVAHQAGAYPGSISMKRLGVYLLPPGWDASPS